MIYCIGYATWARGNSILLVPVIRLCRAFSFHSHLTRETNEFVARRFANLWELKTQWKLNLNWSLRINCKRYFFSSVLFSPFHMEESGRPWKSFHSVTLSTDISFFRDETVTPFLVSHAFKFDRCRKYPKNLVPSGRAASTKSTYGPAR